MRGGGAHAKHLRPTRSRCSPLHHAAHGPPPSLRFASRWRIAERVAVDIVTVALLFVVLGWQWLPLPGLVLEAIPGLGVLPFRLLVVGAIAVLGTPRPKLGQR